MALACNPRLMIADEPTTALDVTIQAQILDLMNRLREETGAAILFITHDLGVIAEMAHRVAVMYAGKVVEEADAEGLFDAPRHPYTVGLLGAIPTLGGGRRARRLSTIAGVVPSLFRLPRGCSFQDRCTRALDLCKDVPPPQVEVNPGHRVSCHRYG
jgi:oligopeptide/dipeptide ABC transporter ATP-binding protein